MWFYTSYFFYVYLIIFDGIPFATTTLARNSVTPVNQSVNPQDIWNELRQVTEHSINTVTRDKAPKNLSQPTSFLNPGYRVLFEHIGQLHQSVYKHYLIVALKIPTLHNMPHEPKQWYKGCEEGIPFLIPAYEKRIFQQVFMEGYCARECFKQLYTDITKMLHSDIPALLPNQVIPYADLNFFNTTPAPMTNNPYHPSDSNNSHTRHKRHLAEEQQEFLPLLELQRG